MSDLIKCKDCGSEDIFYDEGRAEMICANCGRVVEMRLVDSGPEWRAYNYEEQRERERVGAPATPMKSDKGLKTHIGYHPRRDYRGESLSPMQQRKFNILNTLNQQATDAKDRNLRQAIREIERISSQLGIPENIQQAAVLLYRKAMERDLIRGRSINGIATACLFIACRQNGVPRNLKEFSTVLDMDINDLGKYIRTVIQQLNVRFTKPNIRIFIDKLGRQMGFSTPTILLAIKIIEEAEKKNLTIGKNPTNLAAAALYLAGIQNGERKTQQEVAKVAKTTPVTIRNRFKELAQAIDIASLKKELDNEKKSPAERQIARRR